MRLLLKILAAPVIVALTRFVWICSGLLYCSAFIFGIISTVIALLGLAVLVTYSPKNGLILWVIAFLVSPVGLPMAAACILGKVQDLRYWIRMGFIDRGYAKNRSTGANDALVLLFYAFTYF